MKISTHCQIESRAVFAILIGNESEQDEHLSDPVKRADDDSDRKEIRSIAPFCTAPQFSNEPSHREWSVEYGEFLADWIFAVQKALFTR